MGDWKKIKQQLKEAARAQRRAERLAEEAAVREMEKVVDELGSQPVAEASAPEGGEPCA